MGDARDHRGGESTDGDAASTGSRADSLGERTVPGTDRIGGVSVARALTVGLALAVVLAVLGVAYVSTLPPTSTEPYTELYVLGSTGLASNYPTNLTQGETGRFVVGVTNREHASRSYRVELRYRNETVETFETTLADEQSWEQDVSFEAESPGTRRLRILLFREGVGNSTEPYRETSLLVHVRGAADPPASLGPRGTSVTRERPAVHGRPSPTG